jgi:hypothetical protein
MTITDDVKARTDAITRTQHGLITRRQATDAGLSRSAIRHRLAIGTWTDCGHGIYRVAAAPVTPQSRLLERVLGCGAGALASHRSAAALLGIPGFRVEDHDVTVTPDGPRRDGFPVHESDCMPAHHRRVVDGISCTSVARTIFDLCGMFGFRRIGRSARALDTVLARRMVTVAALWRVLDELAVQGRAGAASLRVLLLERGGRAAAPESELERRFLRLVGEAGLPEPELQVDVGDADAWIGRVDFLFRAARLVVEVDGRLAHESLLDVASDRRRDAALAAAGFRVERCTWHDVTTAPETVLRRLRPLVLP